MDNIYNMKNLVKLSGITLFVLLSLSGCTDKEIEVNQYNSEIITYWNELIMDMAVAEDGLLSLKGVRTEAIMHTAIHDALNAIKPLYTVYVFEDMDSSADPMAAVAQAAYEIAISQFPEKNKELEDALSLWLSKVEDGV